MDRIEALVHHDPVVAGQIHALLLRAHAQEAERLGVRHAVAMARTVADVEHGNALHLGALGAERQLLGVVTLEADDEPGQISIATLVVHPQHQRQGIARALMQDALQRGAGEAFSVCVAERNGPAMALYRSLGFAPYRRGTLGDDALAIVKLRRPGLVCSESIGVNP